MFSIGQTVTIKSDDEFNGERATIEQIFSSGTLSVYVEGQDDVFSVEPWETAEFFAIRLQRQLQNGSWIDETDAQRVDMFIRCVLEREPWFAPRIKREPMTTPAEVIGYLRSGKTIHYDDDWYAEIRDGDSVPPRRQPQPLPETLCDCGHYSAHPMNASRGTSCPNCYDRMSD